MKLKASTLILGLCLAMLAVAASPAYARSTTGFSAFHVENQGTLGTNPYTCLGESFGAVVNNCSYAVSLEFDLPTDSPGEKGITVQNYWKGTEASGTFSCQAYAYSGAGSAYPADYAYWGQINFPGPDYSLQLSGFLQGAWSIQLICWNVPPGGGIANINWTE
ncbi:MAG: hypothetical protein WBQ72_21555 [Terriglobales bacterium]|jgi:hypothetical protein